MLANVTFFLVHFALHRLSILLSDLNPVFFAASKENRKWKVEAVNGLCFANRIFSRKTTRRC